MIITRMVVKMDESKLSTIEQIEAFLGASEQVAFTAHAGDTERYAHISRVLRRFDYQARRMRFTKTRPVCNPIGVRRAPRPQGRAGFVRIDTVLSGDIFTCVQLATSGFVTEMVPAGQARSAAQVYASTIATRAPLAVRAHKRSIAACANGDAEQLRVALELIAQCTLSADFVEGRTAFMQKKKAQFTGT